VALKYPCCLQRSFILGDYVTILAIPDYLVYFPSSKCLQCSEREILIAFQLFLLFHF